MSSKKNIYLPATVILFLGAVFLLLTGFSTLHKDYFIVAVSRDGGTDLGIVQAGSGEFKHVLAQNEEILNVSLIGENEITYLCGAGTNIRVKTYSLKQKRLNDNADIKTARILNQEMERHIFINIEGRDDRKVSPAGLEAKACQIPETSYYLYLSNNALNIYDSNTRAAFSAGARGEQFYIAVSDNNEKLAITVPSDIGTVLYLYNLKDMYLIDSIDIPGEVEQAAWSPGADQLVLVYVTGNKHTASRYYLKNTAEAETIYQDNKEFKVFYAEVD